MKDECEWGPWKSKSGNYDEIPWENGSCRSSCACLNTDYFVVFKTCQSVKYHSCLLLIQPTLSLSILPLSLTQHPNRLQPGKSSFSRLNQFPNSFNVHSTWISNQLSTIYLGYWEQPIPKLQNFSSSPHFSSFPLLLSSVFCTLYTILELITWTKQFLWTFNYLA